LQTDGDLSADSGAGFRTAGRSFREPWQGFRVKQEWNMKVGTFRALCAAAVAGALAVPAMAQNDTPTAEGSTRQSPNAARGADGEAGTVRPNVGQSQQDRPGATLRPTAPQAGTIVEEQENLPPGTRRANFPPQTDRQAQGRQGMGQGRLGDAALVRWISVNNESEIRISEAAQQKAQNEQVKQFAQMMVDEHTKLGQKLQQAANQGGEELQRGTENNAIEERIRNRRNTRENETNANENERNQNSPQNNDNANDDQNVSFLQNEDPNARPGQGRLRDAARNAELQGDAAGGNMRRGSNPGVELHAQIKEACTQAFLQELQSKNGAEFDKCYMGQQILAHQDTLATLKVISQQASPELKQTLQQAQQSTQQHLQKAKDVMKQIENERQ
jgi:predicted outer membrane protein